MIWLRLLFTLAALGASLGAAYLHAPFLASAFGFIAGCHCMTLRDWWLEP